MLQPDYTRAYTATYCDDRLRLATRLACGCTRSCMSPKNVKSLMALKLTGSLCSQVNDILEFVPSIVDVPSSQAD